MDLTTLEARRTEIETAITTTEREIAAFQNQADVRRQHLLVLRGRLAEIQNLIETMSTTESKAEDNGVVEAGAEAAAESA